MTRGGRSAFVSGRLGRGSGRARNGEERMKTRDDRTLSGLVEDLHAARLSRRSFVTRAAQMGLAIPVASALATAATREGLAAPTLAFQDGGKTLVVAIPQSTVQLDPAVAGSNGYGDILTLVDIINEGLSGFKPVKAVIVTALAATKVVSSVGQSYC